MSTSPTAAETVAPLVEGTVRRRHTASGRVLGREPSRPFGAAGAGHAAYPLSRCAAANRCGARTSLGWPGRTSPVISTPKGTCSKCSRPCFRDAQGHAARLVGVARWAPGGATAGAARAAAATAAGRGPPPRRGALAAPRRRGDRSSLRRRQRLLPDRARPVDDVLVCPLLRRGDGPRRRAGLQARADLPQARPARAAGRPAARRRLRLGIDGHPCRHSTTTSTWSASRSAVPRPTWPASEPPRPASATGSTSASRTTASSAASSSMQSRRSGCRSTSAPPAWPSTTASSTTHSRPEGRLLNHAISSVGGSKIGRRSFIGRYVFPDGELIDIGESVRAMERAGFEVRDVESLREHYAKTLRAWVANLEAEWDAAVDLAGERRARVWRLYMAASAVNFEAGRINVHQALGVVRPPTAPAECRRRGAAGPDPRARLANKALASPAESTPPLRSRLTRLRRSCLTATAPSNDAHRPGPARSRACHGTARP